MFHLQLLFPCWFSGLEDMSVDVNGVLKIPCCDCITIGLSLYVHQGLLYMFRCFYVGCIYVYKGYILLDWSLVHYIIIFCYGLCFEVYFVLYKYCCPVSCFSLNNSLLQWEFNLLNLTDILQIPGAFFFLICIAISCLDHFLGTSALRYVDVKCSFLHWGLLMS